MKEKSDPKILIEPIGHKGGVGSTLFLSILADIILEAGHGLNIIDPEYSLGDMRRFHPSITQSKENALKFCSYHERYDYLAYFVETTDNLFTIYDGFPPYKELADDSYMLLEGIGQKLRFTFLPVVILDHSFQSRTAAISWIELLRRRDFRFLLVRNYWAGTPPQGTLDSLLGGLYKENILAQFTMPRIPEVVLYGMHELCMSCRTLSKHGKTQPNCCNWDFPTSIWKNAIATWNSIHEEFERTQLLKRILDPIECKVVA